MRSPESALFSEGVANGGCHRQMVRNEDGGNGEDDGDGDGDGEDEEDDGDDDDGGDDEEEGDDEIWGRDRARPCCGISISYYDSS